MNNVHCTDIFLPLQLDSNDMKWKRLFISFFVSLFFASFLFWFQFHSFPTIKKKMSQKWTEYDIIIFSKIESTAKKGTQNKNYDTVWSLETKSLYFVPLWLHAYVYTMIEHLRLQQKLFTKTKLEHKNECWQFCCWIDGSVPMTIESMPIVRFYFPTENQIIFRINLCFGMVLMFNFGMISVYFINVWNQ